MSQPESLSEVGARQRVEPGRNQLRKEALCRSVLYGGLSLGLYPPTRETLAELQSDDAALGLLEAAAVLSARRPPENSDAPVSRVGDGSIHLPGRVARWIETFEALTLDGWLTDYGRLFGHTARGLVCPYETEYGQEGLFQQPRQLARIAGFYRAFGLTTREQERERADHVSCELEFLEFLARKEAYALGCGDDDMLQETRKAVRLFLKDHLGRFGRAFAHQLRTQDGEGFFGKLGDLLNDLVRFECDRLELQPGTPLLQLRSAEEDRVPMACGGGPELVQLEPSR